MSNNVIKNKPLNIKGKQIIRFKLEIKDFKIHATLISRQGTHGLQQLDCPEEDRRMIVIEGANFAIAGNGMAIGSPDNSSCRSSTFPPYDPKEWIRKLVLTFTANGYTQITYNKQQEGEYWFEKATG